MDKTPEELAEEWAKNWRYEGVCDFALGNLQLCNYAQDEVQKRLSRAFLAGHQAAAPQWISVKDRLPPSETEVLWRNKTARQTGVSSWEYMSHCNDTMLYWGDAGNVSIKNFTHWMPLPVAPNEGL